MLLLITRAGLEVEIRETQAAQAVKTNQAAVATTKVVIRQVIAAITKEYLMQAAVVKTAPPTKAAF